MPETVEDGVTAYIVSARDAVAMAEALGRLASEPEMCAAMGTAGRRRWEAMYTADRMVAATEAIDREFAGPARRTVAASGAKAGHAAP
jgi:glycosyltransferase involved in cell wall biosynthesis